MPFFTLSTVVLTCFTTKVFGSFCHYKVVGKQVHALQHGILKYMYTIFHKNKNKANSVRILPVFTSLFFHCNGKNTLLFATAKTQPCFQVHFLSTIITDNSAIYLTQYHG